MRLYSLTGAAAVVDPEFGRFEPDANGGFDFPDELSDRLHRFGSKAGQFWETDIERQARLLHEELERRKDPATLLSAVEQIMNAASAMAAPAPEAAAPAPKASRAKKAAGPNTSPS